MSGLTDVSALIVQESHACALSGVGLLRGWGHDSDGIIGNDSTEDALVPVAPNGL